MGVSPPAQPTTWFFLCNRGSLNVSSKKAMAPHSSTLAWKIPWMEEPGRLQSMGSLRVRHNWATSPSLFMFMHWRRKWQPTPVFLPGESQGWGSLVGCGLWGRRESDTTEWLSSSSSVSYFSLKSPYCSIMFSGLQRKSNLLLLYQIRNCLLRKAYYLLLKLHTRIWSYTAYIWLKLSFTKDLCLV